MMESQNNKENFKAPDNEEYDINKPQNIAKPAFNSTSEKRDLGTVPSTENLNQQNDENNQLEEDTADNPRVQGSLNDEPLHGNDEKTDLGNSRDQDDKEDEKLIRK